MPWRICIIQWQEYGDCQHKRSQDNRNKLPPMAGSQMSFTPLFWSEGDVEKNLEEKLIVYVNMLQATNTENFDLEAIDFKNNPIRKGLYYNMVVPLQGAYYNYEVKFNYLGWPIYLNLGSGSIGPRESISLPLLSAIMPFQKYDIPYDVSYPVMVSIYDSQALEGSGYSFFFALESNVRNNEPVNTDTFQVKSLTQEPMGAVCEEKFKNSGNVSLFVTDKLNNLVDGAVILFSLGQETCYIGEANERGFFTGKFPKGALGSIIVNHPDFAAGYITPFMASNDPKDLGSIALNRYINKNITAKKMEIKKYVPAGLPGSLALWSLVPLRKTLTSKESVTIIFAKVAENPLEEPFVTAVQFNGDETKEIRIIPGNYTINVMLMQDPQTIIIPEDEVCWEDWKGDEECETIPAVTVANNDAYLGGTFEKQIIIGDEIYRNNKIDRMAKKDTLKMLALFMSCLIISLPFIGADARAQAGLTEEVTVIDIKGKDGINNVRAMDQDYVDINVNVRAAAAIQPSDVHILYSGMPTSE